MDKRYSVYNIDLVTTNVINDIMHFNNFDDAKKAAYEMLASTKDYNVEDDELIEANIICIDDNALSNTDKWQIFAIGRIDPIRVSEFGDFNNYNQVSTITESVNTDYTIELSKVDEEFANKLLNSGYAFDCEDSEYEDSEFNNAITVKVHINSKIDAVFEWLDKSQYLFRFESGETKYEFSNSVTAAWNKNWDDVFDFASYCDGCVNRCREAISKFKRKRTMAQRKRDSYAAAEEDYWVKVYERKVAKYQEVAMLIRYNK